jgi:hypothetical protein
LTKTNESAIVTKAKKFRELNTPSIFFFNWQQEVPQPVEEDRQIENNSESVDKEHSGNRDGMANTGQEMERNVSENVRDNRVNQGHNVPGVCTRCGKPGHAPEACHNPIICERCNQEGHVARVCMEKMPWDFNVPFFGIYAYGQGFHFIKSAVTEEGIKDMSNIALITITEGVATAKQIEAEFRLKAGPDPLGGGMPRKSMTINFR